VEHRFSGLRGAGLIGLSLVLTSCQAPRTQGAEPSATAPGASTGITRRLLDSHDMPDQPGYETRIYLIEYGPGVAADPHVHPVAGVGYILEGSFESAFGDEAPTITHQGESFVDQVDKVHRLFRNPSATEPLRFVIAYAVAKGAAVILPATPNNGKEAQMSPKEATASRKLNDSSAAAKPAPQAGGGVRRTVLGTHAVEGVPGWELRVLLIEYDPGVVADPHTHPVPGIGYVLDGAFESIWGAEGNPVEVKSKGESFVDLAHEKHYFRNASRTEPLRFIIAYSIQNGAPTLQPA
jgi:quercetin dioxygenase-like cupin family protein